MTVGELRTLYVQNHVVNLKDCLGTTRRLERYVAQFDALQLNELTKMQVVQWHQEIGKTRGGTAANQALQQLRSMYARAEDWDLYDGKNPADRVKKFPKRSRERFLQSNELPYLLKSLSEEDLRVEGFFLTLLLTGARRDEARLMQWSHLDLNRGLWNKPTTKNGTPHCVPLADQLVTRLRALPHVTDFVFSSSPNPKNGFQAGEWSVTAVEHFWRKIRKRVGLRDVRIHDLRRTAASWLSINGSNIQVVSQVLNHKSLSSTQVYARLSVEPVRLALNDQCERMLGPASAVPTMAIRPQQVASDEERANWPG